MLPIPLEAPAAAHEGRLRLLEMVGDLLANFLVNGCPSARVLRNPLPPDAAIVGARMDVPCNRIVLVLASTSWDVVAEGEAIPRCDDTLYAARARHEPPPYPGQPALPAPRPAAPIARVRRAEPTRAD